MKKEIIFILMILICILLIMTVFSQEFSYVGSDKCKICHKSEKQGQQFPIWEESKHSKSLSALTSEKAPEIAQEAGIENPTESEKCLQCHAPLFEKASDLKEDGVGCEVCHGPGSDYKKLSIMKNREEAVKNGLIVYDSTDVVKNQCLTCHENAHGKSYDFESSWEKIKHPVPEK